MSKTSLVEQGCERARRRGRRVLRARGAQLETGFAFGVVRQLFERELASASPRERAGLLAGPAGPAGELLAGQVAPGGAHDRSFALVHGLYWLTAHLAARQPLLVVVDDAHWADTASLRWLAYLVARLEGPDVAVLTALRPAEPVSREGALLAVRSMAHTVRPALLSPVGSRHWCGPRWCRHPDARCNALLEASGGNPFYLDELLRAGTQGPGVGGARIWSPGPASDEDKAYRGADPAAGSGAARPRPALAVLGDGGQVRHAAAMAGLDIDRAIQLAAGLVRVEVLPPPIRRASFIRSCGPRWRHRWGATNVTPRTGRAARELARDGGAFGQVAVHLMHVQPTGDGWSR
jgi:hypothetical protein